MYYTQSNSICDCTRFLFRNPYPRPVNLPPGSYTKKEGKRTGTRIERLNEMSKPIYVKSIDDTLKDRSKENG